MLSEHRYGYGDCVRLSLSHDNKNFVDAHLDLKSSAAEFFLAGKIRADRLYNEAEALMNTGEFKAAFPLMKQASDAGNRDAPRRHCNDHEDEAAGKVRTS